MIGSKPFVKQPRSQNENKTLPDNVSAPPGAPDLAQPHLLPYLLNRLTARINQLWLEEIRDAGLTVPRWQVLSILAAFDGSRVGQIAELSGSEQPVVSRVIDQMERDGLVERRRGAEDSRAVRVWLTDEARRLLKQLNPAAQQYIARLLADVEGEDVQRAMQVLKRILVSLDAADG